MKKITAEQLERLGQMVDTIDNYLTYKTNPYAPALMKIGAYEHGLVQLRKDLKRLYVEMGGDPETWDV